LLLALLLGASLGCSEPASPPAVPAPPAARPPGELRIRLSFDDSADLDLYVTGPLLETVYYANTPTKVGGELERDARCAGPPGLRSEQIRFAAAPAGRYRVGVDFPERCRLPARPAGFALAIEGDGLQREIRGEIELGIFEPLVLEFDYAGQPRPSPASTP